MAILLDNTGERGYSRAECGISAKTKRRVAGGKKGMNRLAVSLIAVILISVTLSLAWSSSPSELVAEAQGKPTLYWGSGGYDVRLIQWKLQSWGYYRGSIDGCLGRRLLGPSATFKLVMACLLTDWWVLQLGALWDLQELHRLRLLVVL